MAKQLKKYMAVTTASFMVMQLAACGNAETEVVKESDPVNTTDTVENNSQTTNEDELLDVHNSEMADACDEWQESDDGSYECLDENSPYYAQHFFNGLMYATAGAMIGSAIYKSRNLKNGTERDNHSGGAAGSTTTNKSNATNSKNGITTGGSSSTSSGTSTSGSSSNVNSSTSNNTNSNASTSSGSNTNSTNTNSYSSGQRSYSNGSSSSSSGSSYNSSSSNAGKSGFGSGGASRGGSSSS
ncbi:hypothetical protein GY31_11965 [Lysinibacillus sphaericus]|uniref:hypothetical protein n=1 Tax=Lysinibacillus TaxID=400634 RepID=UPI00084BB5ED|nr:hypothetical protein [Lysinibacillus sphaericus]OEC02063.1 hypothetical protein GY31_11965 [Lysinibacillus sphaericus]